MPFYLADPDPGRRQPNYRIRGTYLGVRADCSTGTPVKKVAREALDKLRRDTERRVYGSAPAPKPTFATGLIKYIEGGGSDRFTDPLMKRLGDVTMDQIDQALLDEVAVELYPNASNATRNRQVYTPVLAVLSKAKVLVAIDRPSNSNGEARTDWLKPDEARRLLAAAWKVHPRFAALLTFLLYTGCRLSEALALQPRDLELADATCSIRRTKTGKPREPFLPPVVVSAIRRALMEPVNGCYTTPVTQPRTTGTVFCLTKSGHLYGLLDEVAKAAKVEISDGVAFHIFRHTYGAWMRRYGKRHLHETGAWSSRQGSASYDHFDVTEAAMAANKFPGADDSVGPELAEVAAACSARAQG